MTERKPRASRTRPSGSGRARGEPPAASVATARAPAVAAAPAPPSLPALDSEWLEPDGLGGFASGTVAGIRSRRYHALLLAATTPPTGRMVFVNGIEARVSTPRGVYDLSAQRYLPDIVHPDGWRRIESFTIDPWPTWAFRLEDGTRIEQQIHSVYGAPGAVLSWRVVDGPSDEIALSVRPLLSGRDTHALHHENAAFRFDAELRDGGVRWKPYDGVPAVLALSNGSYAHAPEWYRNFLYSEERARGLDDVEDLASPGAFLFDLSRGDGLLMLTLEGSVEGAEPSSEPRSAGMPGFLARTSADVERRLTLLRDDERLRRRAFASPLERAADAYLVRRGSGMTIVAGYPWFTDWGRDTFISLRGLCLATGRFDDARRILVEWAGVVSQGLLPNRFAEAGDEPEYNSVDASLWYVIAVHDFLRAAAEPGRHVAAGDLKALRDAVAAIVAGYAGGTRYGVRMDEDGLLAAGEAGVQLTWMDAKVGDWVVTPRIGKPVEIEALWINALRIAGEFEPRWMEAHDRARASFERRFWNEAAGGLYDVVDVDHVAGTADASIRPNQIFAVGGLPYPLLEGRRARRAVDRVEERLWTPVGLRTLAPGEAAYVARYQGGVRERDGSYHQGTAWPWLIGPFVEAWLRVRRGTAKAKRAARERFVAPLLDHLQVAGLGHISEIADADPPHTPRGCPFQAWSVGEVIRALRMTETQRP